MTTSAIAEYGHQKQSMDSFFWRFNTDWYVSGYQKLYELTIAQRS